MVYSIKNPVTGQDVTHPTHAWKYEYAAHLRPVEDNRLYWGTNGENTYPRLKVFLSEMDEGIVPVNLWKHEDVGTTDGAGKDLESLMDSKVFDFLKPVSLIKYIIQIAAVKDGDLIGSFLYQLKRA